MISDSDKGAKCVLERADLYGELFLYIIDNEQFNNENNNNISDKMMNVIKALIWMEHDGENENLEVTFSQSPQEVLTFYKNVPVNDDVPPNRRG